MTYPLFALAGCTVLIGLICLLAGPFWGTTEWFAHHLHATLGFESLGHEEHHFDWVTAIVGTLAGVGGLGLSYRDVRRAQPAARPAGRAAPAACTRRRWTSSTSTRSMSGWSSGRPAHWRSCASFSTRTWWIGW